MQKLTDAEVHAIRQAVEDNLGIAGEEVAITVHSNGRIEADCMLLEKIPEHSLYALKQGHVYQKDDEKVYVEATEVREPRQVVFNISQVK